MELRTATPKEIDLVLAEIHDRIGRQNHKILEIQTRIKGYQKVIANDNPPYYQSYQVKEAVVSLAEWEAALSLAIARLDSLYEEARPLNDEFTRRDGWTRAFIVKNSNGHVHNTLRCGSCYPTTQFAWLPEVSGDNEQEIVDKAGSSACTFCYASAPVDLRSTPSVFEEPEKKAARLERDAQKAVRASEKAAKGITNPDGTPLREEGYIGRSGLQRGAVIATERAALILVTDNLAYEQAYGYSHKVGENARIIAALAHKWGQSIEEATTAIDAKVAAKIKKWSK
jgi:hypothetical protein